MCSDKLPAALSHETSFLQRNGLRPYLGPRKLSTNQRQDDDTTLDLQSEVGRPGVGWLARLTMLRVGVGSTYRPSDLWLWQRSGCSGTWMVTRRDVRPNVGMMIHGARLGQGLITN